ncbi:hypothetical protein Trydic_g1246 [Trypoxylus dichotomus]
MVITDNILSSLAKWMGVHHQLFGILQQLKSLAADLEKKSNYRQYLPRRFKVNLDNELLQIAKLVKADVAGATVSKKCDALEL